MAAIEGSRDRERKVGVPSAGDRFNHGVTESTEVREGPPGCPG